VKDSNAPAPEPWRPVGSLDVLLCYSLRPNTPVLPPAPGMRVAVPNPHAARGGPTGARDHALFGGSRVATGRACRERAHEQRPGGVSSGMASPRWDLGRAELVGQSGPELEAVPPLKAIPVSSAAAAARRGSCPAPPSAGWRSTFRRRQRSVSDKPCASWLAAPAQPLELPARGSGAPLGRHRDSQHIPEGNGWRWLWRQLAARRADPTSSERKVLALSCKLRSGGSGYVRDEE